MKKGGLHSWIRRIWLSAATLFMVWLVWNVQSHGVAAGLLQSGPTLTVSVEDEMTVFLPASVTPDDPACEG